MKRDEGETEGDFGATGVAGGGFVGVGLLVVGLAAGMRPGDEGRFEGFGGGMKPTTRGRDVGLEWVDMDVGAERTESIAPTGLLTSFLIGPQLGGL